MNWNELSPGYPPDVFESILKSLSPGVISCYPEYDQIYPLTAGFLKVGEEQIILEAGSECGIKNVFEVFVPKDTTIVLPSPGFVMVPVYASIFGARMRTVDFNRDLNLPIPTFLNAIDRDTSLVYLANPNSPTGQYLDKADIRKILTRANEADAVVLLDECYIDFSERPSCLDLIEEHDNLIISRSFSKAFGLAGVRLGVLATNSPLCSQLHKTRPMREINAFAAEIGKYMLQNIDIPLAMIRNVIETRGWVAQELREYGYSVPDSSINSLLVDFGKDKERFVSKCEGLGILVKDGLDHEAVSQYVSITVGTRDLMENVLSSVFPL